MVKKESTSPKIFVLDTSVILYNHHSIFSFENNDVAIPITVLEELDNFKKGNDTKILKQGNSSALLISFLPTTLFATGSPGLSEWRFF